MIDRSRSTLNGLLYGLIALTLHWWGQYKSWWWYDNAAHLSAGIALGGLLASEESSPVEDLLTVVGLSFVWELAEYGTGTYPWGSLPDRAAAEETTLDVLLVVFGASVSIREARQ